MESLAVIIQFLVRDVALWGELKSPMLSWLGSGGLILFLLWQVTKLLRESARITGPFDRVRPLLAHLAQQVEASDLKQAFGRACPSTSAVGPKTALSAPDEVDLDKVTALDRAMREVEVFQRPWIQYRKTLLIEHVPWFKEPRIFSTRRADDFFTSEAILTSRMDLDFYGQMPSLITGIGLLLTFVAICVGLSRIHADGQSLTGIQGLVNGLAGKFITSIVGLVCANLFMLVEKPVVRRLAGLHREFVALLDESFPRKTAEELLDELGSLHRDRAPARRAGKVGEPARLGDAAGDPLHARIEALTSAVGTLVARMGEPPIGAFAAFRTELIQGLQAGFQSPLRELNQAVRGLTAALKAAEATHPNQQAQIETPVGRQALARSWSDRESPWEEIAAGPRAS